MDDEVLEFRYGPPGHRTVPSYRVAYAGLRTLRDFVDIVLIEIFVDDGGACCTKRIDSRSKVEAVRWTSDDPGASARMWSLEDARTIG